jgi:hypothetical protein
MPNVNSADHSRYPSRYPSHYPRPRIAFCTTCKNRTQHLEKTLPRNLADNADYPNLVQVVLDYSSQDHLIPYLKLNHIEALLSGRLVVYQFSDPGPFRMAHAKNMAHRLGMMEGADILVNLDADNYTGKGFAGYIAEQFSQVDVFLWSGIIKGQGKRFRGCSGRIVVTPDAFLKTGGYDEKYDTWAPDDKDFNARLQRMGYTAVEIDRRYLEAIPHNDGLRFKEYPHARVFMQAGDSSGDPDPYDDPVGAVKLSGITVANYARLGMGRVRRNLNPKWIELGPIPTRIFGIGMHKTATNSLHQALKLLGYNSAHWESGEWARMVWSEMKQDGRSKSLERYYAASDLPITLLYRELDKAYPGSKFILTVRSEESWLRSVRDHFSYRHNPFRWEWDVYPFTNRIHQVLYGQTGYDALVMLERYRRHNREVREYFRNRPDALLVMDMETGAGWEELCGFLGKNEPMVPYPKSYVTRRIS